MRAVPRKWLEDLFSDYEVLSANLQSTFDLRGYGAAAAGINYHSESDYEIRYCDYILISNDRKTFSLRNKHLIYYTRNGDTTRSSGSQICSYNEHIKFYGDVRYENGEKAPTDSAIPDLDFTIGELPDGTPVTIEDLLGTDGTVNGQDVLPHWDSFLDDSLLDLINAILDQVKQAEQARDDFDKDIDKAIEDYYNEELGQQIAEISPENVSDVKTAVSEVAATVPLFGDVRSYLPRLLKLFVIDSKPNDITITISLKPLADFEKTYTLIKYSWFQGGEFSEMLLFVRRFATLLVSVFLLLKIYKRVVGFFGGVADYKDSHNI